MLRFDRCCMVAEVQPPTGLLGSKGQFFMTQLVLRVVVVCNFVQVFERWSCNRDERLKPTSTNVNAPVQHIPDFHQTNLNRRERARVDNGGECSEEPEPGTRQMATISATINITSIIIVLITAISLIVPIIDTMMVITCCSGCSVCPASASASLQCVRASVGRRPVR